MVVQAHTLPQPPGVPRCGGVHSFGGGKLLQTPLAEVTPEATSLHATPGQTVIVI